ncbi:MAG: primosomal protein N' [Candidatus Aminicenantes bacterium]|nr:primosomal protein N' [Candidatus Aminicenantes bacterium]
MTLYAEVILSLPLDQSFSYVIPESCKERAKIGSRVLVPLGQRTLTGFIVELRKRRISPGIKLKEIAEVLDDEPIFSSSFLSFTRKLCAYYYSSWGELLQASLPPSFMLKSKTTVGISDKGSAALQGQDLSRDERELLGLFRKRSYSALFLKRKFKVKNLSPLLSRLEKKGFIFVKKEVKKAREKTATAVSAAQTQLEIDFSLDAQSREVADQITRKLEKKVFSPFFLYGPPAKREAVYSSLIKEILARGRRVLFLVPEITLIQTLIEKFEKRLGEKVALLHSQLSESKREAEWRRIKEGEADVVVGPRSALFSPVDHLGLIIVDEEEDDSYYQLESPSYDARKGAWLRAKHEGAALVYGSALPSVEAFYRARKGKYLFCLDAEVVKTKFEIVDDRQERGLISSKLRQNISERLEKKEPILVFFNRRGYASFLFCSRCNYISRCIHCDIALTYHKREERLVCHYCNYSVAKMIRCPDCGSRMIRERGAGIEAVEEELKTIFPQGRIALFTTDLNKREQERILRNFWSGRIDILVGTQLLAHQVELPPASLVAILFPETILTLADYRASQKTFQTLSRMIEFVKSDNRGEVIIQTALPQHFSIRQAALKDYFSFFREELKLRRLMNYPPFSSMAEILFQGENLRTVARESREFSTRVKSFDGAVEILGPALASVSKVRGINRVQVILKARRKKDLDKVLREALKTIKLRKSVWVYE